MMNLFPLLLSKKNTPQTRPPEARSGRPNAVCILCLVMQTIGCGLFILCLYGDHDLRLKWLQSLQYVIPDYGLNFLAVMFFLNCIAFFVIFGLFFGWMPTIRSKKYGGAGVIYPAMLSLCMINTFLPALVLIVLFVPF